METNSLVDSMSKSSVSKVCDKGAQDYGENVKQTSYKTTSVSALQISDASPKTETT